MLFHFTARLFSAGIPYRWALFAVETFITARLFPAEILYCWVMFFKHADVFVAGIVHGPLLTVPT